MTAPLRLGVALSGSGTTLQNFLDLAAAGTLPVSVTAVVSSRADAYGLERARRASIPCCTVARSDYRSRRAFSEEIFAFFTNHDVQVVALAGYLKRLKIPPQYEGRVLNVHPALLPAFGGKGMYLDRVHEAVLAAGVQESGCTVHVVDDEYDHGRILLQERVPVDPDDSVSSLGERVIAAERRTYPEVLRRIATGELVL